MRSILTVLQATDVRDFVSLDVAKDELAIKGNDDDTRLQRWIADASGLIEGHIGFAVAREQVQEIMRRDRGSAAIVRNAAPEILRRFPVVSIDGVSEDGGPDLDPSLYEVDQDDGLLWRLYAAGRRQAWRYSRLKIVYTAGLVLPDGISGKYRPLATACLELLKLRWASRDRDPTVKAETVPGVLETQYWIGSIGENGALPPNVLDMLELFREVRA